MKQSNQSRWTWPGTALVTILALSVALTASAQGRSRPRDGGEGGGGGTAVPRGTPAPSPSPSPSPAPSPAPANDPVATPRRAPGTSGNSGGTESGTATARPRQGRTTAGTAVPRGSVPPPPSRTTVFVPAGYYGGYWPWGFGGLGFGSYYYGAFDPYYGGYAPGYGSGSVSGVGDGALRLKVKPRDAQVYVDGYYAGIVDDFDGVFQRLHLEPGAHHIEVRAEGYETLTLDVQIRPDQTTKFEGDLKKAQ